MIFGIGPFLALSMLLFFRMPSWLHVRRLACLAYADARNRKERQSRGTTIGLSKFGGQHGFRCSVSTITKVGTKYVNGWRRHCECD